MPSNKVRTRFAPSPTGYMHVGNLRTALYTYLMAKHEGGTFILRIEDTDQGRYVEGAVDVIYNTLRETGLLWDEGPDVGGPVGPYVQSERMGMFKQYAEQLVAELREITFPDVVRAAGSFSFLAVGVALEIVLQLFHGRGTMQHHWLSAICTEYQTGEEIWFVHLFCGPLFMLAHLLHDLPLLL